MKKIIIILFIISFPMTHAKSILFLGDSLTEGYGISRDAAFPKLVEALIKERLKKDIHIINGGVSGSTTSDGLARLKWYLKKNPYLVILALGANDGLRGLNLNQSRKNLETIVEHAQKSKAKVLLAQMLLPPNYGAKYTADFKNMYEIVQKKYKLETLPFLLDGVAGKSEYNQKDGIHPNERGHKIIATKVFNILKKHL